MKGKRLLHLIKPHVPHFLQLGSAQAHLISIHQAASLQSPGQAHSCISPAWASLGWSLNSRNCELGAGIDGGRGGSAMQLRWAR